MAIKSKVRLQKLADNHLSESKAPRVSKNGKLRAKIKSNGANLPQSVTLEEAKAAAADLIQWLEKNRNRYDNLI